VWEITQPRIYIYIYIYIEGSRIIAIGVYLDGFDAEVINATGMIDIPGFIDTHRHAWQGSLRRLLLNSRVLKEYSLAIHHGVAKHYRPEDVYAGTLVTALSCIDSGITTIIDNFHNARSAAHGRAGNFG
jgi:5-methylthioadenosine/S-adenosylhomocysteine deaminase